MKAFFKVQKNKDTVLITPKGNICDEASKDLKKRLNDFVEKGQLNYSFDLKNVKEIDATGFKIFVLLYKIVSSKQKNFSLKILNANEVINNLFYKTCLNTPYEIIQA